MTQLVTPPEAIGASLPRVDARSKVIGAATYSAEHRIDGVLYGVIVLSTIARGEIVEIDATAARSVDGFVAIVSHENTPPLNGAVTGRPGLDKNLPLFNAKQIYFDRQPIAVVVATTLHAAQEAAALIRTTYGAQEAPLATLDDTRGVVFPPKQTSHDEPADMQRGDVFAARSASATVLRATYSTPVENHNPIEPHASIAVWDADRLTVYDATQGVFEERRKLAAVFGLPEENVRIISPYVGGGFGNKGSVWWHQCLTAAAARHVGRPLKVVLARDQMFAITGHRSKTVQRITFGSDVNGKIASFEHVITGETSMFDDFTESSGEYSAMAYAFPNVDIRHRLVRLNVGTPTFMRAPGEATGTYVLEAALDELAAELGLDPIELRLRNYAETDPNKKKPFSTKYLRECYRLGAERFGWERRPARPRSMRDGRELIGYGMAGGAYPAQIFKASASVTLSSDGTAIVRSGTHDMGQGTYTALAQIAASELGIDPQYVRLELGDTAFPRAMNSGGSTTIASVGSAVALACREIKRLQSEPHGSPAAALQASAQYEGGGERDKYSPYSFAAQFAEVAVDPDFGTVRVRRMFGMFDVGRVINPRLTRSQLIGGMTMGIGMALFEQTRIDPHSARMMNANLADYLIPTNADIGEIDAAVIGREDPIANPIGTKPVGEIGICGAAAAIANAVYNATGQRVRDLPIGPARLR